MMPKWFEIHEYAVGHAESFEPKMKSTGPLVHELLHSIAVRQADASNSNTPSTKFWRGLNKNTRMCVLRDKSLDLLFGET